MSLNQAGLKCQGDDLWIHRNPPYLQRVEQQICFVNVVSIPDFRVLDFLEDN
jgi:hypothetical protein